MKRIEPIRHALAGAPQCHQHHKRTRSYSADEITDVKRARHTAIETQLDKEEEEPELELYSEISGALRLSDIEEESDESLSDQKRYHSYEGRPLSSRAQALDPGTYRSVGLRGSSDVIGFDREPTVDPPETLLTAPRCSRISPEEVDDLYTYSELYSEDERDNSDDESEGSARTCPFDEIRTVVTADGDLDVIVSLRQEFSNMPVRLYVQRHSELSAEHHTRATESCKSTLTSRSPESPDFVPSTTSAANVHRVDASFKYAQSNEAKKATRRDTGHKAANEAWPVVSGPVEDTMDRVKDWVQKVGSTPAIREEWPCLYKGCMAIPFQDYCTRNRRRHMDCVHLKLHDIDCPVSTCGKTARNPARLKAHMKKHTEHERDACGWNTFELPKDPVYGGWVQDWMAHPERYNPPALDDPIRMWARENSGLEPGDEVWDKLCRLPGDDNPYALARPHGPRRS